MMLQLYDGAWTEIMEGLDLRANWLADCGEKDGAHRVRELMTSLEKLGSNVLGGRIDGYRLTMTAPRQQALEIRVCVTKDRASQQCEVKMAAKRSFSAADTPRKSEDYHGMAKYVNTSPDIAAKGVESVNVHFTFEEALRLSLAIQACLMNLNKYDRSKGSTGRNMGLSLSLKTASTSVAVIETAV